MSEPCLLLDEHIPHAVGRGLALHEPAVHIFVIGREGAPPISAPDAELLLWIEQHGCLLVTNNHASIPVHLRNHLAVGRHIPGILVISPRHSVGLIIEELYLVRSASLLDEYVTKSCYLPHQR